MITAKKFQDMLEGIYRSEVQTSNFLHLTVNENQLSVNANKLLSTKLSERYFFGSGDSNSIVDFGSYTFRGLPEVDRLVSSATHKIKKITGASEVSLNCFSGLHAMMCAILVSTNPGETVMSIPFEDGGHFATKGMVESLGRKHIFAKFDPKKQDFNVKKTTTIFNKINAKVLYIDISTYLTSLDVKKLRDSLHRDAVIIYDASHSLGLIMGGVFPSPFQQGADIICSNTHKTFAGPQSGIILFKNKKFGKRANKKINTTFISSVNTARLAVLSLSILEHSSFGKKYSKQIIANSIALATALVKKGYELRKINNGAYSNNEQVHLFLDQYGDKIELYRRLIGNNISTNFMQIMGGQTFARIGTQEITRRGMREKDMKTIANLLDGALKGKNVKDKVIKFNSKFKKIKYSFDK